MKHFLLVISIISLLISGRICNAQVNFPDPGVIYSISQVPRIDIFINPDTLNLIYENPHIDREYRANFVFDNNEGIHDSISEVGFRLRGNTSRDSQKKSFKVSFNTFVDGRKYRGVEKLDLNGEHNDPSSCRSILYWHLLREAQLVGSRANHVSVFINGSYYGLYTNVEHIDEEFVKTYFGNNDGNLYKCLWPADLTWLGSNQNSYKFRNDDRRTYELKTNEELDDYSDLVELINIINNTPINDLPCKLESVFNVPAYLKTAALDVLTSNWDGYAYNKNNFYLYHNQETGLFEYIPYDVDNTFGIDWFNINWTNRNMYNWASGEPRPLFKKLMQVPDYKAQYTYYMRQLISKVFNNPDFIEFKNNLREQARPYLINDPLYPLDYGFTIVSYDNSWIIGNGGHVPFGINEFIQKRMASALEQCSSNNAKPIITRIHDNEPGPKEDLMISAVIEEDNLESAEVLFRINQGEWLSMPMNDDGSEGDLRAGDGIFTANLQGYPGGTEIEYFIKASDESAAETTKPCEAMYYKYAIDANATFELWPNPAYGKEVYLSKAIDYKLYDLNGRMLKEDTNTSTVEISAIPAGIFVLKTNEGSLFKLIIIR